jgi:prevent-host-death family protein
MRFVNIKKFHAKMWEYINRLPLIVTKYGEPFLVIVSYEEWKQGRDV